MAQYRRSEIISGMFILLAVGVFGLFAFGVGGIRLPRAFARSSTLCTTFVPDVKTLEVGQKVTVGGQRVGKVEGITIAGPQDPDYLRFLERFPRESADPGRAVLRVDFAVWDDLGLLVDPDAVRVELATDGFLGTHFVKLDPGPVATRGARVEELGRHGTVLVGFRATLGLTELSGDIAGLIDEARVLLRRFNTEVLSPGNVAHLSSLIERLDRALERAPEIGANLANLVDPAHPESVQRRLLDPAGRLLASAEDSLRRLEDELLQVWAPRVRGVLDQAQAAAANADVAITELRQAVQDLKGQIQGYDGKIHTILDRLVAATRDFDERLLAIEKRVHDTLGQLERLLADARPEVAETLQTLRRAMWEMEIAMRKVRANPATLIFGDSERILDVAPADESDRQQMGRVRPFQQRGEGDGR
jgi:ABC-type transporter Mla subunit MlaD